MKPCPLCAKDLRDPAVFCRWCNAEEQADGSWIVPSRWSSPPSTPTNAYGIRVITVAIVVLAIAFCGLMIFKSTTNVSNPPAPAPPSGEATESSSMSSWVARSRPAVSVLASDFGDVGAAGKAGDLAATRRACRMMQGDIEVVRRLLPSPNSNYNTEMTAALSEFDKAAQSCIAGTDSFSATLLEQAIDHIDAGNQHLVKANALAS